MRNNGRGRAALASVCGLALAVAAGCGGGDEETAPARDKAPAARPAEPAPEPEPTAGDDDGAAMATARKIFATRCATCHGPEGRGDGPGSAGLDPKPRNFQDPEWQASVSDEHIQQIILYGGAAVGKSPTMPGNPDLQGKPEVVEALVAHIRSLGPS